MRSHTPLRSLQALLVFLLVLSFGSVAALAAALDAKAIVAAADRSEADRAQDVKRKPAEFLAFAGLRPGMRVADIGAGAGYTTELLARAVGPEGKVFGHNTPQVIEKYVKESWPARLAQPAMKGVVRVDREMVDPLPPEADELDVITMIYIYHDTLFSGVDRPTMNRRLLSALKRGGSLVVVDHRAKPGSDATVAETIHRMDEQQLQRELEAAGFELAAESEFMGNPADPREKPFYEMDGPTDTFVHRYVRPN